MPRLTLLERSASSLGAYAPGDVMSDRTDPESPFGYLGLTFDDVLLPRGIRRRPQ